MDETGRREQVALEDASPRDGGTVRVHESRPGRHVFTEDGNTDGWIATDLTLDPEP